VDDDLGAVVAGVWARMASGFRRDAARLEELVLRLDGDVRAARAVDADAWREVRDLAHRLAGSLGSLGQREAGEHAVALEDLTAGRTAPDRATWDELVGHASAVRRQLGDGPAA
jgi:HPt (histidine-containing phosphotransfer) domain-containing protein